MKIGYKIHTYFRKMHKNIECIMMTENFFHSSCCREMNDPTTRRTYHIRIKSLSVFLIFQIELAKYFIVYTSL